MLKPTYDKEEAAWSQQVLAQITCNASFNVARPVAAQNGSWVHAGWMASKWVPGKTGPAGHWPELLGAARAFHRALINVPRPGFVDRPRHRWAVADRVVWDGLEIEWIRDLQWRYDLIREGLTPGSLSNSQIIHGDLAGNVLFTDAGPPTVIDFSPYWRPSRFSEAVAIVDGLLWYDQATAIAAWIPRDEEFSQLLRRALIFRLAALNLNARSTGLDYTEELPSIDRVTRFIHRWPRIS